MRSFFFFGIAGNLDNIHAVGQRARNLERAHVAGADEEDFQKGHKEEFEVMIG